MISSPTPDLPPALIGGMDKRSVDSNHASSMSSRTKKEKVQADSTVRVYGRGGAQNINQKLKEGGKSGGSGSKKLGGLKGLRKLV